MATFILILIADPVWQDHPIIQKSIQFIGATLIVGAVLGRLWSTLYIGGRKNITLMTKGPYSITRNPLYFFSTIGSVGAGLVFGSVALGALAGVAVGVILYATSRGEAALLSSHFGSSYRHYAARVPLFWPQPGIYEEASDTTFDPRALKWALGDTILFLLVIPFAGAVDLLRHSGLLPRLIMLF
ncbi:methyltransferase family protein [Pseudorhodoplanes sinuspersici]|uniref:methyltransferase family protein n=1 Tax=Pseudorhodoplanes sinuspersici TaxID=1235591 RepID=UPI0012FE56AF|nr:isoprenylcysteine carboxylmethyltransferase family protein [Pseudorhodoplanes sinuspersici]